MGYLFRMIDLHTHTLFSDGELLPFELVRRAGVKGYTAMALTDHMDASNVDFVIPRIVRAARELMDASPVRVLPGVELTHVPPSLIADMAGEARRFGALIVVVHGETLMEPVEPGTNRAAIMAGVDVLAHPGLIDEDDVALAVEHGVALEITARKGHSISNGHVARLALKHGARLVINTDTHAPGDLIDDATARNILRGAGIPPEFVEGIFENSSALVLKALGRKNA